MWIAPPVGRPLLSRMKEHQFLLTVYRLRGPARAQEMPKMRKGSLTSYAATWFPRGSGSPGFK
jgi:hypothetical protein